MSLEQIGADARVRELFLAHAAAGGELGRVSFASHEHYQVLLEAGEYDAAPAGRLRWQDALPAVGDWVVARRVDSALALIEILLPRRTQFSRRAAGRPLAEQVIAANIDLAVIVSGLDADFNLRRIERYLVLAREGGAEPLIVLNKADLSRSPAEAVESVARLAGGAGVVALSAHQSVEPLIPIVRGRTVAFLGSSGTGKSTIANALLGESRQATGPVRPADSRGRHTTTTRMLLPLPGGGALIDNPGMRELQLWADEQTVDDTFADVADFVARCRFADCSHAAEPGCAVREALEAGGLDSARWQNYLKLKAELRRNALQQDARARTLQKQRWKTIARSLRNHPKYRQ